GHRLVRDRLAADRGADRRHRPDFARGGPHLPRTRRRWRVGGAALMGLEHAPQKKRGFGASAANMGGPAGGALAALVYAAFSSMPEDEFLAWGWRVPFLFSAVLVGVGLFVRLKVAESPVFEAAKKRAGDPRKAPPAILLVIRKYH